MRNKPGHVQRFTGVALPLDGIASRFSVMGRVPHVVAVGQSHSPFIVLSKIQRVNVIRYKYASLS